MKRYLNLAICVAVLFFGFCAPAPKKAQAKFSIEDLCQKLSLRIKANGNVMPDDILYPKIAARNWSSVKVMVCMLEFRDVKTQLDPNFIKTRVQGKGTTDPSLEEYYTTNSNGTLKMDFGPEGVRPKWVRMPKALQSYTMSKFDYNCVPAVLNDAYNAAVASGLSPEDYDDDGNGKPDFFIMIFGGNSWTTGGNIPGDFMSSFDGMTWIMVGEDVLNTRGYDLKCSPITLYHEFGHCLGLADLYDHTYQKGSPVGGWDVMGDGVWRGYCGMFAFNREKLGWCQIKEIKDPGVYEVDDLDGSGQNKCLKIEIPGGANEYILIENRQRTDIGYCKSSPDSGLVFYHWNAGRAYTNDYNDTNPQKAIGIAVISLKQERYYPTANFSADSGRDRLDMSLSPDVASWFSMRKEVSLIFKNISKSGSTMTFELEYLKPIVPTIQVVKSVDFGVVRMGQTKTLPVNFFFTGKSPVRIDLEKDADWIDVDLNNFIGKDQNVEVTINTKELSLGAYKARIKYSNDFKSGAIDIAVQVRSVTGDTNADFVVDDTDVANFFACYGTTSDDLLYQPDCDFNDDNRIDFLDALLLSKYYGKDLRH